MVSQDYGEIPHTLILNIHMCSSRCVIASQHCTPCTTNVLTGHAFYIFGSRLNRHRTNNTLIMAPLALSSHHQNIVFANFYQRENSLQLSSAHDFMVVHNHSAQFRVQSSSLLLYSFRTPFRTCLWWMIDTKTSKSPHGIILFTAVIIFVNKVRTLTSFTTATMWNSIHFSFPQLL